MFSNERELLARMLQAEAGNQGRLGMQAVGAVIDNRRRTPGYGGDTFEAVMMAPGQFSPANSITGYAGGEQGVDWGNLTASETAYEVADTILSGNYEDPTGGALNFLNPTISQPDWLDDMRNTRQIGDHLFGTAGAASARPRNGAPYQGSVITGGGGDTRVSGGEGGDRLAEGARTPRLSDVQEQGSSNSFADALTGFSNSATMPDEAPVRFGQRPATGGRRRAIPRMDTSGIGFAPKLGENLPVPFNPNTTQAFANYGLDNLSEADVNQAFGGYAEVGNGAFNLAAQAVGGPTGYGIAETDAPATVREATEAIKPVPDDQQPSPFDVAAYKKQRGRRRFAADALEILSVGLGQISANQPLDLGRVLQNQRERRIAMDGSMAGNGSNGGEGGTIGAYSDLLIPGNEEARDAFLLQNGVDPRAVAMASNLGPGYARELVETAIDYRLATPEREQMQRRRTRAADWARRNAPSPEQGEYAYDAVMSSPEIFETVEGQMAQDIISGGATVAGLGPALLAEEAVQSNPTLRAQVEDYIAAGDMEGLAKIAKELRDNNEGAAEYQGLRDMNDDALVAYGKQVGVDVAQYTTPVGVDREGLVSAVDEVQTNRRREVRLQEEAQPLMQGAIDVFNSGATGPEVSTLEAAYRVAEDAMRRNTFTPEMASDLQAAVLAAGGSTGGAPGVLEATRAAQDLATTYGVTVPQDLLERAQIPGARGNQARQQIIDMRNRALNAQAGTAGSAAGSPQEGEEIILPSTVAGYMSTVSGPSSAVVSGTYSMYQDAVDIFGEESQQAQQLARRIQGLTEEGATAAITAAGTGQGETAAEFERLGARQDYFASRGYDGPALDAMTDGDFNDGIAIYQADLEAEQAQLEAERIQQRAEVVGDRLAEQFGRPELAEEFANVRTEAELNAAHERIIASLPSDVRSAYAAMSDDTMAQVLQAQSRTSAGMPNLLETQTITQLNNFNERTKDYADTYAGRMGLRAGQKQILDIISAPGYDPSSGGPLTPLIAGVSNVLGQALGEEFGRLLQSGDENAAYRLIAANTGEFFGDFRAEGSGQMTEVEGKYFRAAMAGGADSTMKQALLAQRILRMDQNAKVAIDARREWLDEKLMAGDMAAVRKEEGLDEFVSTRMEEAAAPIFPIFEGDANDVDARTQFMENNAAHLDDQTVVSYMSGGERQFVFYRDFRRANEIMQGQ